MNGEETSLPKDWREARRLRAWELKQKGWKQRDIAEALGVSDGAVSQWLKRARKNGRKALRSRHGGGPKKRLTDDQRDRLPKLLANGAQHFGFEDDNWTHSRVAALIKREFEVSYTPTHAGRILKEIGWSQPDHSGNNRDDPGIHKSRTGRGG
jgi:transposase